MAKLLADDQIVVRPWRIWLRTVGIGAVIGIIFWIVTILLTRYVVEPLACRDVANATNCVNATALSGNISTVITAALAILILVRLRVIQPVILAVGSAALLWDLAAWAIGLSWIESLGWSILLYALSFGLFAWLTRYSRLILAIIISVLLIVIIRIALIL